MFRKWWFWVIVGTVLVIGLVLFLGLVALMIGTGAPTSSGFSEVTIEGVSSEKIVVVYLDGVIGEASLFGSSFDGSWFMQQLDQAISDDQVQAVVLRVNSPGGSVVASDEIYEKILDVKQAGKKVVVSMGELAASGGYYVSAPADYIFANRATLTGSLGVIFTLPNYEGLAEWVGYKETNITSGEFKDIGNSLRELRPEERAIYQALINESYERFVDIIAEGRQLTRQETYKLADGRIYSGKQAVDNGLVDELGSLEDAISFTKELAGTSNMRVVEYTRPLSFTQSLLGFQRKQTEPLEKVLAEIVPTSRVEPGLMYLYNP